MEASVPLERSKSRYVLCCVPILIAVVGGCSLIDLDEFHRGGGTLDDAGASPGAGSDAGTESDADESPVGPPCGENKYCALAPPQGWSFVAVRFGEAGDCPPGYGDAVDFVELGPANEGNLCGCSCGEPMGSASCTNGNVRLEQSPSFVCIGLTTTNIQATCTSVDVNLSSDAFVRVVAVPPTQAACSSTMQNVKPPPPTTSPARSCALVEPTSSEGCSADQRCISVPKDGYGLCVARAANATCPKGYSRRRSLGTSVVDTRTCDSCRCETTDTCANPRVELFETPGCTGTPATITASSTCKSSGTRGSFKSARYQADVVPGGCKLVGEEIKGSLSLKEEITVCCPSGAGN